jgi:coenzyme F420-0:L-glutamate ligase/coenzyme F420-1:gamma-L-glutamate ligase
MPAPALTLTAIPDLPLVDPGDDLAGILIDGLARAGIAPGARDVLVVAQKVVSKAENRYCDLGAVTPSNRARDLARAVDKDPRLVEVILSESAAVVAHKPGVLVVAHRLGFVLANAGIDRSNVGSEAGAERVLLLPEDPDASAAALKARLDAHFKTEIAVIVSDSLGRAWRNGVTGIALGAAGLPALRDMIGRKDLFR